MYFGIMQGRLSKVKNGIFQFLTGPFINKGFKIVDRQNNAIKILIGKFIKPNIAILQILFY